MTKEIPLTQGKVALVDDQDFDRMASYRWYAAKDHNTWYAYRHAGRVFGISKRISMHKEVLNTPDGMLTDHKNGNGLDNRRDNLRPCSHSENMKNAKKPKDNHSGFKGVYFNKHNKRWHAQISVNNKRIHIGLFVDVEEAAQAYDEAARKYHGEFARTNF